MNQEFETMAWVNGTRRIQIPVIVNYEADGYKPLIDSIVEKADPENDLTNAIDQTEQDLIYFKLSNYLAEKFVAAADYLSDLEAS